MSQRKVSRLRLDPLITERLIQNGISTAKDIIECPILTLMDTANLSYSDTVSLVSVVGAKLIKSQTALEALQFSSSPLSQFVPNGAHGSCTSSMGGGYLIGSISEVCGPPGIGKTQLCLGCCAQVLMDQYLQHTQSDRRGGVVYYDTELKFSPQRLLEIILARYPETAQPHEEGSDMSVAEHLLARVSVRRPMSCRELHSDLLQLDGYIISEGISLVVVDSIAALPRNEGVTRREEENFALQQAGVLQTLAQSCLCAILVTNQIAPATQRAHSSDTHLGDVFRDQGVSLRPSLGVAWHHCLSTRVVLYREDRTSSDAPSGSDINFTSASSPKITNQEKYLPRHEKRVMWLQKSPASPNLKEYFSITLRGVECQAEGNS